MVQLEANARIVGVKDIKTKNGKEMRMIHLVSTMQDNTMYGQKTMVAWAFEGGELFMENPHNLVDHECVVAEVSGKVAIVAIDDGED